MYCVIRAASAAVFDNRTLRLTPAQVRAKTGCTHVMNGWVFNKKFQPCDWTVVNGRVVSTGAYGDYGFSCGKSGSPVMTTDREQAFFLTGVPLLKDGIKLKRNMTPDVARAAERTAVGWLKDGSVLLWCDRAAMTREQLQDKLLDLGCVDALMFDGGGSTQGVFPGGKLTSGRKVATLLCFWEAQDAEETKGERPMVEINAYSLKKDGSKKLSTNFRVREFACKDGSDAVLVAPRLVMVLQSIRDHFGAGVNITSGYRTPQYNQKVGGVENSQHCYGTAADITVNGVSVEKVAAYARKIMPDWGGVATYQKQGFVHVDVRETRSDWNG